MRRDRRWRAKLIYPTDLEIVLMLITNSLGSVRVVALGSKIIPDKLAERGIMKRRKDRPLVGCEIKNPLVASQSRLEFTPESRLGVYRVFLKSIGTPV
jgi:hypothetical protein